MVAGRSAGQRVNAIGRPAGAMYALVMLALPACGHQAQPPAAKPGPSATRSPAPTTSVSLSPQAVTSNGYVEGRALIGPIQPVERAGVPSPTPSAGACTARGLVIYASATGTEVQRISFAPDCTYRVALPSGTYRLELDGRGIDTTKDLPREVTVAAGLSTHVDVAIDTGIR